MQYSTNYNLKKPDYTDFADIQDINDNMDTIDAQLAAPTGDSADSTTTFTTSDTADGGASSWTNVPALTSGETHKSLFAKMSQMFKNIRFLYKMLGTTDISSIGNGTVTNALSVLNAKAFHVTNAGAPSGYKAVQMIFKSAGGITPILISDGDQNAFIALPNSDIAGSTPAVFDLVWLKNAGSISTVTYAKYGTNYRIKVTYANSPAAAGWLCLDGRVDFLEQQFVAS